MKKLFPSFNDYNTLFWQRIGDSTQISEQSLSIFRWIFGLFLLFFGTPYYGWIGNTPQAFFDPPLMSLANLFNEFPAGIFFRILDIIVVISILSITIGFKTRIAATVLFISVILGNNFLYSFGKVDHGNIMQYILLLLMIFSNWGKYYALKPESEYLSSKHCLSLFAAILAFGMFTAGIKKAMVWIDFDINTGGALSWLYDNYFSLGRQFLLASVAMKMPYWLFEFIDYFVPIFETLGYVALLYKRKTWLIWLLLASLFHFGNVLILNIAFQSHFLAYLVFVDFGQLRLTKQVFLAKKIRLTLFIITILLSIAHLIDRLAGRGSQVLFIHDVSVKREYALYFSLGIWLTAIIILFTHILQINTYETKPKSNSIT